MSFAHLALICLVAMVGPLLSLPRGLAVPVVVGELLVGLVLGATGLGVLDATNPTFGFLGEIGFALVMFVAGTHVPMRDPALRKGARAGLLRAALVGVLSVPVAYGIATAFGTGHTALYAVLLASSSASIVMPSLAGLPLTGRPVVELLPQLAVADAACIVALPFAIDPAHVARAALGAALVLVASGLAYVLLRWVETSGRRKRVHDLSEERGLALELRTALALVFGITALAQWGHVSIMLAGFGVGVALAAVGPPRRLSNQVFALTEGFFGPVFFVWLGSSLNLRNLLSHPASIGLGVVLGVAALLVHGAMALTRQPLPVAMTTAAQLGVPVAAVTTGAGTGLFGPGEGTALLLGALVTVAATAALSHSVAGIARRSAPAPTQPQGKNGSSAVG